MKKRSKQTRFPIEIKSIASLIDELITADLKCWHQQESVYDASLKPEQRHRAAVQAHEANARRCDLMRAIDRRFSDTTGVLPKTFKP